MKINLISQVTLSFNIEDGHSTTPNSIIKSYGEEKVIKFVKDSIYDMPSHLALEHFSLIEKNHPISATSVGSSGEIVSIIFAEISPFAEGVHVIKSQKDIRSDDFLCITTIYKRHDSKNISQEGVKQGVEALLGLMEHLNLRKLSIKKSEDNKVIDSVFSTRSPSMLNKNHQEDRFSTINSTKEHLIIEVTPDFLKSEKRLT